MGPRISTRWAPGAEDHERVAGSCSRITGTVQLASGDAKIARYVIAQISKAKGGPWESPPWSCGLVPRGLGEIPTLPADRPICLTPPRYRPRREQLSQLAGLEWLQD